MSKVETKQKMENSEEENEEDSQNEEEQEEDEIIDLDDVVEENEVNINKDEINLEPKEKFQLPIPGVPNHSLSLHNLDISIL